MKLTISITPDHAPITKEEVERLPVKPDEEFRSIVRYYRECKTQKEFEEAIRLFAMLADKFEEAFDNNFETHIYFWQDPQEPVGESPKQFFVDKYLLPDLEKLRACLCIEPGPKGDKWND